MLHIASDADAVGSKLRIHRGVDKDYFRRKASRHLRDSPLRLLETLTSRCQTPMIRCAVVCHQGLSQANATKAATGK